MKFLDKNGFPRIVARQALRLLLGGKCKEAIKTPQGSSGIWGKAEEDPPPAQLSRASGVFLVAQVRAVMAFPEESPERVEMALPAQVL